MASRPTKDCAKTRPPRATPRLLRDAARLIAVALLGSTALYGASPEVSSAAATADDKAQTVPSASGSDLRWHVELKRQFTERGTPEASSRTMLRLEATPKSFVSLVRIDLPFMDKKNGDPMTPRLGDLKLKFESRPVPLDGTRLFPSLEVTFPTADPPSLGNGKYQIGPGIELWVPLGASGQAGTPRLWDIGVKPLVRQVVSVGGDEASQDINYTQLEPALKIAWRQKLTLSLTPKMVFDWEQGGESGAVFELEPGWNISRRWRTELTLGHELWGRGLPSTYGKKVELTLRFNF